MCFVCVLYPEGIFGGSADFKASPTIFRPLKGSGRRGGGVAKMLYPPTNPAPTWTPIDVNKTADILYQTIGSPFQSI